MQNLYSTNYKDMPILLSYGWRLEDWIKNSPFSSDRYKKCDTSLTLQIYSLYMFIIF